MSWRCVVTDTCTILHRSSIQKLKTFSNQHHLTRRLLQGATMDDTTSKTVGKEEEEVCHSKPTPPPLSSGNASPVSHDDGEGSEKYSYFNKGYTSEIFKIQLVNIPERIGYQNLRKYLTSLDLNPGKIKKPESRRGTAYINFRCEEDRARALKCLDGRVWKSKSLIAKEAHPAPDPLYQRKRARPQDTAAMEAKRAKLESMTLEERLNSAVTPWLDIPYQEQLMKKTSAMKDALRKMAKAITRRNSHPGEWFDRQVKENDGMMCPLEPIKSSPILEGYRSKCECTIGVCPRDGKVVVGFRLGSYVEGSFEVVSAASCHHVPARTKELIELFEQYLNRFSDLPPYSSREEQGYWRMLTVRCYDSGESMAVIHMHPQQLAPEAIEFEKSKLKVFFTSGEGSKAPPTSLYFQAMGRLESNVEHLYEHLLGEKHVHEDLLGLKFRISPAAFFQVNTRAAEMLYTVIGDLARTETVESPVIYDICCGTGTIGLYLAKALSARRVVGIEMVKQAVEDARANAQINGVSNANFVCGKAEEVMSEVQLPWVRDRELVGIVDPPRGGLHHTVSRTIRKCQLIQKLIYVSCNPNAVAQNFVDLCGKNSNRLSGRPFRPVSATPIDLFPHTPNCELVVVLERVTKEEEGEEGSAKGEDPAKSLERVTKEEEGSAKGEDPAKSLERVTEEGEGSAKGEDPSKSLERVMEEGEGLAKSLDSTEEPVKGLAEAEEKAN